MLVGDARIGRLFRAVRQELGLRQVDVARLAAVPRATITAVERGWLDDLQVGVVRRVASALEVRVAIESSWRGGAGDRLVDRDHAAVVEHVAQVLARAGWQVEAEFTFNHFGERGSIDLLAWHERSAALLVIEAKTRLTDLQALLAGLGRKRRIAPELVARERGWRCRAIGEVLVATGVTANRNVVAAHPRLFASRLGGRAHEIRAWIRRPSGDLAGIWFVAPTVLGPGGGARRQRVRRPRERG